MEGKAMKKTAFFDQRLLVDLPDSFHSMEKQRAENRYPSEARPQILMEDKEHSRFCTFSLIKNQWLAESQIQYAIQSVCSLVVSLYPSCLQKEAEIVEKDKGSYGWFAFEIMGEKGKVWNIMYVIPVDGCMMLGTMGCMENDEDGKEQMIHIMRSLEVQENRQIYAERNVVFYMKNVRSLKP